MKKTQKYSKAHIERYNHISMTQPLSYGVIMQQMFDRTDEGWKVTYSSNSAYHICPFDGSYRNCKDCGALEENFDISFCTNKIETIDSAAVCERVNDCYNAGLKVEFYD